MPVKTFADTSDVAIAITEANVENAQEFAALDTADKAMLYVPFQSETMTANLEASRSTAITTNRRDRSQKNTSGTATGGFVVEFGQTAFVDTLLRMGMMGEWATVPGGEMLVDSEDRNFLYIEKRVRREDDNGDPVNEFRRWYGNYVDELSIEMSPGDLTTMTVSTMAILGRRKPDTVFAYYNPIMDDPEYARNAELEQARDEAIRIAMEHFERLMRRRAQYRGKR